MTRARASIAIVAFGTICALAVTAFVARVEVRHSAAYGFSQTIDRSRSIAVPGGYVVANYPEFNRVDLDLRAYSDAQFDLTIHIREVGAEHDARTLHLDVDGSTVFHRKGAFANPFTTVRFDPIPDSAGRTYYVWIERGPRNQEDVITLWSIKSYSRMDTAGVVAAMVRRADDAWGGAFAATTLAGAAIATLAASFLLVIGLARSADRDPTQSDSRRGFLA